ncbi:uncharacterized protein EAF01_004640 [Botrytis porri]|uniref:uncharacterized protein n=1 Tax=Botrytis porri TaxID=87229 RepID=UPI0019008C7D|nr:uncharacterized protein EAF01_004640 [Botrytis porri]KAF7907053.1 hypothetical protein EAF01_004640 [Botrytis porri]
MIPIVCHTVSFLQPVADYTEAIATVKQKDSGFMAEETPPIPVKPNSISSEMDSCSGQMSN